MELEEPSSPQTSNSWNKPRPSVQEFGESYLFDRSYLIAATACKTDEEDFPILHRKVLFQFQTLVQISAVLFNVCTLGTLILDPFHWKHVVVPLSFVVVYLIFIVLNLKFHYVHTRTQFGIVLYVCEVILLMTNVVVIILLLPTDPEIHGEYRYLSWVLIVVYVTYISFPLPIYGAFLLTCSFFAIYLGISLVNRDQTVLDTILLKQQVSGIQIPTTFMIQEHFQTSLFSIS